MKQGGLKRGTRLISFLKHTPSLIFYPGTAQGEGPWLSLPSQSQEGCAGQQGEAHPCAEEQKLGQDRPAEVSSLPQDE